MSASGGCEVWAATRRKWLCLTPEEEVRRRVVAYLVGSLSVPATHIAEEYPVVLNGQPQRADIVVFDPQLKPWLVIECKAPDVPLARSVLEQVVRYNSVIGAQVMILTNGRKLHAYSYDSQGVLREIPFPL